MPESRYARDAGRPWKKGHLLCVHRPLRKKETTWQGLGKL